MDAVGSMLFTPGPRPDLIAKASRSAADAVIVDPEDAVATNVKKDARANLASLIGGFNTRNRCGHSIGGTLPVSSNGGLLRGGICTCLRMTK